MQTRSKIFDDISQLMTNAAGVAQGARTEAETAMRGWFERFLADSNLVTREEFEAVRDMAIKAREENDRLSRRVDELEAKHRGGQSSAGSSSAGQSSTGQFATGQSSAGTPGQGQGGGASGQSGAGLP